MRKSLVFLSALPLLLGAFVFSSEVFAGDFTWSGTYRFEATTVSEPSLRGNYPRKEYGTHHLILSPKIIASDGLTIQSKFHIFNSPSTSPYGPNQIGQVFGNSGLGPASSTGAETTRNSSSVGQSLQPETLQISELYATLQQEFGSLVVGRVPLQFGLGITHNAGRGAFDHWYDTRDLVGYKIVMGNIFLFPMYGKLQEGAVDQADDVDEIMIQLQYENPESEMELGVFYQNRRASDEASRAPMASESPTTGIGGAGSTRRSDVKYKMYNIYALKDTSHFRLGLEASFMDGESGVQTSTFNEVEFDAYAVALEAMYRPQESPWSLGLKAGIVSGDDPSTDNRFEGYGLDRNYDVAFLLMNHPMGQADVFRSGYFGGGPGTEGKVSNKLDTEVISNVLYFAPTFDYRWTDSYTINVGLATGWLSNDPQANVSASKDLGYEIDLGFTYEPHKNFRWVNQFGYFTPGKAFEAGQSLETSSTFGFTSKAAISF